MGTVTAFRGAHAFTARAGLAGVSRAARCTTRVARVRAKRATTAHNPTSLGAEAAAADGSAFCGEPGMLAEGVVLATEVPRTLGAVSVLPAGDEAAARVSLAEVWGASMQAGVVIALLRHFGCAFCWEHARSLATMQDELARAGVRLIVVGIEPAEGAANLASQMGFADGVVFADSQMRAHSALALPKGLGAMFNNRMLSASWREGRTGASFRAALQGYDARAFRGIKIEQTKQLGGLVVLNAAARCTYLHRDRVMGDHAPPHAWRRAAGLDAAPTSTPSPAPATAPTSSMS